MSDAEITCEILKIAVAIIGLYFIVQRLKLTEEVFKEDHDRRKKESTLTAYNVIRDSFREIHSELCSKLNIDKHTSEPITDEVVDRIVNEDSHRIKVTGADFI